MPADVLREAIANIFVGLGVPKEMASRGADVVVTADLRGVPSHGVSGVLDKYVRWYRNGEINPRPRWEVVSETAATANIHADRGLGIMLAPLAMEMAIAKARATGVGMVTLHGGRHLGMCGYHAMLALPKDMIGVCSSAAPPLMVPPGGREPRLGSNPLAVAVPALRLPPFVFDAAMTVTSGHQVGMARRSGELIPPGHIADETGAPVMTPMPAPAETRLLPLGSTPETGSHKGFGLACVIEILAGVLSGGGFAARLGFDVANHLLLAIDIAAFQAPETFKSEMDDYLASLEATPPQDSLKPVRYPGRSAWETEQELVEKGIPLDRSTLEMLRDLGESLESAQGGRP